MNNRIKRIFFGLEVNSPWPNDLPLGRVLAESNRHLTLAFLGAIDYPQIESVLDELPLPPPVGFSGLFHKVLFLPERRSRVAAWDIVWKENATALLAYREALLAALCEKGFRIREKRNFRPHATISRQPFDKKAWKEAFHPLPMHTANVHLYESLGNSAYRPLRSWEVLPPFQEVEHTADIAFQIYGLDYQGLYAHALLALAFKEPAIMCLAPGLKDPQEIDEIIRCLNEAIARLDERQGCSLKAVSYHGDVVKQGPIYKWEMIADV